ncbi:MAG: BlaI/MecI/CopY family transcriptional regulator [Angelakisella sp.]|jgi:BlaI family penicillinase repressor|nr:BlaI/MecI/CopY family transcriptional regulator [Angelakisella sp.]
MKMSDSEMKIMALIWENGGVVTTAWLTQRLGETGWKATTILTFLARLEEKGFLTVRKNGRQNLYEAAISREEYQREETQSFIRQIHGGSYKSLFAALCAPGQLTAGEVEELRRWFEGEDGTKGGQ